MPYIEPSLRSEVDKWVTDLGIAVLLTNLKTPGDSRGGIMNYVITRLLLEVFSQESYAEISAAIGTLECAKLEFYRRRAADYEDAKAASNGDVF